MWLDKESQIDLLAYSPFAELITNITANERLNPLTIGLFGRWGAGKSTLLKLVEKNIEERDETKKKFVCISLNSWVFEVRLWKACFELLWIISLLLKDLRMK